MKPVQDCFEIEYEEIFCLYGEEILNEFEKYASDKEWEKYQKTRAIFQYVFLINWALSHYLEYVFDTYIKTEEDSQKIHENYQEVLRKWRLKERLLIAGNL